MSMYCGGGQRGVVCALRIRKMTSLEEAYLYQIEAVEWMWINADLQSFGLNP